MNDRLRTEGLNDGELFFVVFIALLVLSGIAILIHQHKTRSGFFASKKIDTSPRYPPIHQKIRQSERWRPPDLIGDTKPYNAPRLNEAGFSVLCRG